MDVTVLSRHLEVSDKFKEHAETKLARVGKFDPRLSTVVVRVVREQNPRVPEPIRVELTCRGTGPVVRAEGSAGDKFGAFDVAFARLEERLRRAHGKRVSRTQHRPSLTDAITALNGVADGAASADEIDAVEAFDAADGSRPLIDVDGDGPLVVREKFHDDAPISLGDALHQMELVGHNFYLFVDKECGLPSVVYLRRGYDYGVLRLGADPQA